MSFSNRRKADTQRVVKRLQLPILEEIYDIARWDPSAVNPLRPANAFILFRTWLVLTRKKELSNLKIKEISGTISSEWSSATDEVRDHFNQLATSLKRIHNEIYPGYRYRPRKPSKNETISRRSQSIHKATTFPSSYRGAQSSVPNARRDVLEGLHGHGRNPTAESSSLPQDPFFSGTPSMSGPFWLVYPSGCTPGSLQNSVPLTNSSQAWVYDPALAPNPSGHAFPELSGVQATKERMGFTSFSLTPNSEWNSMLEPQPVAGSIYGAPSVYHGQPSTFSVEDTHLDSWMDKYIDFKD